MTIIESLAENSTAASRSTFWRTIRLGFGADAESAARESGAATADRSESGMDTGSGRSEDVASMVSVSMPRGAASESIYALMGSSEAMGMESGPGR